MNRLFTLILLVFAFSVNAQTKNDSKITVKTATPYKEVMQTTLQALSDNGYQVALLNSEFGQITTAPKAGRSYHTKLSILVRDGDSTQVTITGSIALSGLPGYSPIEYRGAKGSPALKSWAELETIAKIYQRATIQYSK